MSSKLEQLWNSCLYQIKANVNETTYRTWFLPIVPFKYADDKLILQVPTHFFREYIEENFAPLIYNTIINVFGPQVSLCYKLQVVNDGTERSTTTLPASKPQASVVNAAPEATSPFTNANRAQFDANLNNNYSFDNYIEGVTNRLARAAGINISENPGTTLFNPMFIYGASAVGKTHLANAIGLATKQRYPEKRVLYISANLFQQQYTSAVHNNTQNDFLMFYQSIDLLIVDDIQDFCNKKQTQNTFFHIFNHLHQLGKQLILCSDREPSKLEGMEDRILSRFKWGLTVEIERPDYNLRHDILNHKVYQDGLNIPSDVIDYIAQNVTSSVREIEGILLSILAHSTFTDAEIDIELAKKVIGNTEKTVAKRDKEITIERICDVVCQYYALPIEEINSKSKKQKVSEARKVAMYLSRYHTDSPLSTIGLSIGNRDHSTVVHACKTIKDQMDVDAQLTTRVHNIEDMLHN